MTLIWLTTCSHYFKKCSSFFDGIDDLIDNLTYISVTKNASQNLITFALEVCFMTSKFGLADDANLNLDKSCYNSQTCWDIGTSRNACL